MGRVDAKITFVEPESLRQDSVEQGRVVDNRPA
jgi:hypothetical protein